MKKGKGYAWGLSSVILSSVSIASPFLGVIFMSDESTMIASILPFLYICIPPVGFVVAFIGRVKSEHGTRARKLCNIGAGIGMAMCAIFIWSFVGVFLEESIPEYPAVITSLVDMVLISGYLLIAYAKGKLLWFMRTKADKISNQ